MTSYLGTVNSSVDTKDRAQILADAIGAHHMAVTIDEATKAIGSILKQVTDKEPKFQSQGGSMGEDLALQNIQARIRMVTSFMFAQLTPWMKDQ